MFVPLELAIDPHVRTSVPHWDARAVAARNCFSAVAAHASVVTKMAARKHSNHDALHQLLRARPTLDRLLDSILAAGADEGRTTVDDILADGEVPRRQAINLLRDLESLGYGAFKVGRKGHPSRFEWSIDPAELAAALDAGSEPDSDDDDESSETTTLNHDEPALAELSRARTTERDIAHHYVLRPDCRVSLNLPDNLTRREAEVLADWIRNLSFER
jgi:hypothetical protein